MVYTEIKNRNGNKYYYRVKSIRRGDKVNKARIYLGINLSNIRLIEEIKKADKRLVNSESMNFRTLKNKIRKVLKINNIKKAGIFGSYARGDDRQDSDVDILIEPPKKIGLGIITIELELEKALGKKVDLISYNGIDPKLKKLILKDEIRIL